MFELDEPENRKRDGIDGLLRIGPHEIEFELKSTTKDSVTTVRDFGMEHIRKWKNKHWLFGYYTVRGNALRFTRYASARMMSGWIEEKKKYIERDFILADLASENLTTDDLYSVCGRKNKYSLEDAKALQKQQLSRNEYHEMMDLEGGYSVGRMLDLLKLRCSYVIRRGSTLNNPHIPKVVLERFPVITSEHAAELRKLVAQELKA